MASGSMTEAAKRELKAAQEERVSSVSSLANYNPLRYLSVYKI